MYTCKKFFLRRLLPILSIMLICSLLTDNSFQASAKIVIKEEDATTIISVIEASCDTFPRQKKDVATTVKPKSEESKSEKPKDDSSYDYSESQEDWSQNFIWYYGEILTPDLGTAMGPSGFETYYNLPMEGVIDIMVSEGFNDKYWVRSDGVKMYGKYVMVAANLEIHPRGSHVKTTRGMGIVCDTGSFAYSNPYQLDIAVDW